MSFCKVQVHDLNQRLKKPSYTHNFVGLVLGVYLCTTCILLRKVTAAIVSEFRRGASNLWFVSALTSRAELRVCRVFSRNSWSNCSFGVWEQVIVDNMLVTNHVFTGLRLCLKVQICMAWKQSPGTHPLLPFLSPLLLLPGPPANSLEGGKSVGGWTEVEMRLNRQIVSRLNLPCPARL